MSSTNKTANYQLSQFVGTDIPSILNDYNGDMRKIDSAIKDASVAGGDNATAIAELQTSTARMNTEIGGINSTVNTLSGRVVGIEDVIPATASEQNKLLTAQELPEIPSITELQEQVDEMGADVKAIQLCVPANASQNNKLATTNQIPDTSDFVHNEDFEDYKTYFTDMEGATVPMIFGKYDASDDTTEKSLQRAWNEFKEYFLSTGGDITDNYMLSIFNNCSLYIDGIYYRTSEIFGAPNYDPKFTGISTTGSGFEVYDLRLTLTNSDISISTWYKNTIAYGQTPTRDAVTPARALTVKIVTGNRPYLPSHIYPLAD